MGQNKKRLARQAQAQAQAQAAAASAAASHAEAGGTATHTGTGKRRGRPQSRVRAESQLSEEHEHAVDDSREDSDANLSDSMQANGRPSLLMEQPTQVQHNEIIQLQREAVINYRKAMLSRLMFHKCTLEEQVSKHIKALEAIERAKDIHHTFHLESRPVELTSEIHERPETKGIANEDTAPSLSDDKIESCVVRETYESVRDADANVVNGNTEASNPELADNPLVASIEERKVSPVLPPTPLDTSSQDNTSPQTAPSTDTNTVSPKMELESRLSTEDILNTVSSNDTPSVNDTQCSVAISNIEGNAQTPQMLSSVPETDKSLPAYQTPSHIVLSPPIQNVPFASDMPLEPLRTNDTKTHFIQTDEPSSHPKLAPLHLKPMTSTSAEVKVKPDPEEISEPNTEHESISNVQDSVPKNGALNYYRADSPSPPASHNLTLPQVDASQKKHTAASPRSSNVKPTAKLSQKWLSKEDSLPVLQRKQEVLTSKLDAVDKSFYYGRKGPPTCIPRLKTHWDLLLEEMQWMAIDYAQERRWKISTSKAISSILARRQSQRSRSEYSDAAAIEQSCTEEHDKKQLANKTSQMIASAWEQSDIYAVRPLEPESPDVTLESALQFFSDPVFASSEVTAPLPDFSPFDDRVLSFNEVYIPPIGFDQNDIVEVQAGLVNPSSPATFAQPNVVEAILEPPLSMALRRLQETKSRITLNDMSSFSSKLCNSRIPSYQITALSYFDAFSDVGIGSIVQDAPSVGHTSCCVAWCCEQLSRAYNVSPKALIITGRKGLIAWKYEFQRQMPTLAVSVLDIGTAQKNQASSQVSDSTSSQVTFLPIQDVQAVLKTGVLSTLRYSCVVFDSRGQDWLYQEPSCLNSRETFTTHVQTLTELLMASAVATCERRVALLERPHAGQSLRQDGIAILVFFALSSFFNTIDDLTPALMSPNSPLHGTSSSCYQRLQQVLDTLSISLHQFDHVHGLLSSKTTTCVVRIAMAALQKRRYREVLTLLASHGTLSANDVTSLAHALVLLRRACFHAELVLVQSARLPSLVNPNPPQSTAANNKGQLVSTASLHNATSKAPNTSGLKANLTTAAVEAVAYNTGTPPPVALSQLSQVPPLLSPSTASVPTHTSTFVKVEAVPSSSPAVRTSPVTTLVPPSAKQRMRSRAVCNKFWSGLPGCFRTCDPNFNTCHVDTEPIVNRSCKLAELLKILNERKGQKLVVVVATRDEHLILHQFLCASDIAHTYGGGYGRNDDMAVAWFLAQSELCHFNDHTSGCILTCTKDMLSTSQGVVPHAADALVVMSDDWAEPTDFCALFGGVERAIPCTVIRFVINNTVEDVLTIEGFNWSRMRTKTLQTLLGAESDVEMELAQLNIPPTPLNTQLFTAAPSLGDTSSESHVVGTDGASISLIPSAPQLPYFEWVRALSCRMGSAERFFQAEHCWCLPVGPLPNPFEVRIPETDPDSHAAATLATLLVNFNCLKPSRLVVQASAAHATRTPESNEPMEASGVSKEQVEPDDLERLRRAGLGVAEDEQRIALLYRAAEAQSVSAANNFNSVKSELRQTGETVEPFLQLHPLNSKHLDELLLWPSWTAHTQAPYSSNSRVNVTYLNKSNGKGNRRPRAHSRVEKLKRPGEPLPHTTTHNKRPREEQPGLYSRQPLYNINNFVFPSHKLPSFRDIDEPEPAPASVTLEAWSLSEDQDLLKLIETYGCQWLLLEHLFNLHSSQNKLRSARQCMKRYQELVPQSAATRTSIDDHSSQRGLSNTVKLEHADTESCIYCGVPGSSVQPQAWTQWKQEMSRVRSPVTANNNNRNHGVTAADRFTSLLVSADGRPKLPRLPDDIAEAHTSHTAAFRLANVNLSWSPKDVASHTRPAPDARSWSRHSDGAAAQQQQPLAHPQQQSQPAPQVQTPSQSQLQQHPKPITVSATVIAGNPGSRPLPSTGTAAPSAAHPSHSSTAGNLYPTGPGPGASQLQFQPRPQSHPHSHARPTGPGPNISVTAPVQNVHRPQPRPAATNRIAGGPGHAHTHSQQTMSVGGGHQQSSTMLFNHSGGAAATAVGGSSGSNVASGAGMGTGAGSGSVLSSGGQTTTSTTAPTSRMGQFAAMPVMSGALGFSGLGSSAGMGLNSSSTSSLLSGVMAGSVGMSLSHSHTHGHPSVNNVGVSRASGVVPVGVGVGVGMPLLLSGAAGVGVGDMSASGDRERERELLNQIHSPDITAILARSDLSETRKVELIAGLLNNRSK